MWTIIFLTDGVFQCWLDRFLIGVQSFSQNINFFIFSGLCMLVSICYTF